MRRRGIQPVAWGKEVSGVALVVAQQVPTSSTMAIPHGPAGVCTARRRLRAELAECGTPGTVVDDAVLILSELLSNSCRHARPLGGHGDNGDGAIRCGWHIGTDGLLTVEVTDGGGPTRPIPASPSLTARGGRGLGIVGQLALDWGVRDAPGEVTVWAVLPVRARHARRDGFANGIAVPHMAVSPIGRVVGLDGNFQDPFEELA
jgi:anti-sigma regulatory factor (Ser/Thr protein kinase)